MPAMEAFPWLALPKLLPDLKGAWVQWWLLSKSSLVVTSESMHVQVFYRPGPERGSCVLLLRSMYVPQSTETVR